MKNSVYRIYVNVYTFLVPGRDQRLSPEVIDLTEDIEDDGADVSEVTLLDLTRIPEFQPRRRIRTSRNHLDANLSNVPTINSIPSPVTRPPVAVGGGIFYGARRTRNRSQTQRRTLLENGFRNSRKKAQDSSNSIAERVSPPPGFCYDVHPHNNIACAKCGNELVSDEKKSIFAAKCGHLFCSTCAKELRKKTVPCPVQHCRKRITKKFIFPLYL